MRSALPVVCLCLVLPSAYAEDPPPLRPPAVPLVTHDPYLSVWSFGDTLTESWTRHWTGANQALCGIVRIDGKPWRFLGPEPREAPAMKQTRLSLTPTRTDCFFEAAGVELALSFLSPLLPTDLDVLSRPVTYITFTLRSTDGGEHEAVVYLDASAEWAVNTPDQAVNASRYQLGATTVLRFGTADQPVLRRAGDGVRIDWGYFYLAAPGDGPASSVIAPHTAARNLFVERGALPDSDDMRFPRAACDNWPVLAFTLNAGKVAAEPVRRRLLIAYDDLYSIEFLHRRLRPYWRRAGMEIDELLWAADRDYTKLRERCAAFDDELLADLRQVGGEAYARIAALAYRQCMAAHKLAADFDGTPLMFPKENFSNGCISTVDVFYPSAPMFLLLSPRLMQAQLQPVMEYARSPRWKFPFAPHDLGTYPLANGQVYGGGERSVEGQMPVEESANMILLAAALAQAQGRPDFANRYAAQLRKWAEYLDDKGFDPEHQLCTDDFAGPLAHNTNLSLKAILALGAWAQLCERTKRGEEAQTYRRIAEELAARWVKEAADGDHYRLAFDKPGTWSQKYNLAWDGVLGLKLFPPDVARSEIAYYLSKQNAFGLPLDNRETYTKLDWIFWTATLAADKPEFERFVDPVYRFVNESPSRVPLTDWYSTLDARQVGFQARSVVGGVFMPMLKDPATREKWQKRAK